MKQKIPIKLAYVGGEDLSLRLPIIRLLRSAGYDVYGVGPSVKEKQLFELNNIPYEIYNLKKSFGIFSEIMSFMSLRSIFTKNRFEMIHAFDTKPTILARIAAKTAGVPFIIGTIPGLGSLFSEDSHTNKVLRKFYKLGQKAACRVSDITIFQNTDDMKFFTLNKMVAPSKAALIKGSGVDVSTFSPDRIWQGDLSQLEAELGSTKDEVKILLIGRLLKHKGIKEYLEAARIIMERHGNIGFYLVGPLDKSIYGFPLETLNEYKDAVKYIGPRNDIPEILSLADIVVLPSYYREGVPRILLEAGCLGKPIVTTDVPGCREVVEDQVNGYLITPKDPGAIASAIEKLVLSKELRKEMGQKSREKILSEFSLDIVFKNTLYIYNSILQA